MEYSLIVSILALGVSVVTAWLTLFRRGRVNMTQPTVVYFGPDGGPHTPGENRNKIYLRCLLFSTGKRGRIIQEMFVRLRRGESSQTFNIWVHGEQHLVRGSGVFVGPEGLATNHHFLLPRDGTPFEFLPGHYRLEVYVGVLGSRAPALLRTIDLSVSEQHAATLKKGDDGLYFDWGPDSQKYFPHPHRSWEPPLGELVRISEKPPD